MPPAASPDKKRVRRKKDPLAPKRAMSAFMFFSNDIRDTVKKERPDLQFLEIASEIGRRWQELPEKGRKKYQVMADKDKGRYEEEKKDYTPDPSFQTGRKKKDPDAPKRSLSAYLYYCADFRESVKKKHPGKKITEIASVLADQWRNLPDKKRGKYHKQAEEDKARYVAEMEVWNAKAEAKYFSTMKSVALVLSTLSMASAFAPATQKASSTAMNGAISRETILSEPDTTEFGKIWDPLGLAEMGSDETIAWFRHSEIKHGRVAMAAFVGWWAVGAGLRFPGELAHGLDTSSIPSKGLEAWDAVPGWGKAQMLLFAGLIELHDEIFFSTRGTHYMKGGTPGKNMVPGLFDPFGLSKGRSEEAKAKGRSSEIKNGRLAMIGVAGLWAAATLEGSVPLQPPC